MTDPRFAHLAQRLVDRPLAIHPAKARLVIGALADRIGIERVRALDDTGALVELPAASLAAEAAALSAGPAPERRAYEVVDGVAIVPVEGLLVHKWGLDPWCGITGYDGIAAKLAAALDDDAVRAVWLDIDSGGGEVAGCFDLADAIRAARAAEGGGKPVWAVLSEVAYSAAYALASQADRIVVPRTGGVGSIGVITMHLDQSRALDGAGLTLTLIHAGAHKADRNPYEPLGDSVREMVQAEVEDLRSLFVDTVAAGRGIAAEAVRATEARVYAGPAGLAEARRLGLIDSVAGQAAAWRALRAELDGA